MEPIALSNITATFIHVDAPLVYTEKVTSPGCMFIHHQPKKEVIPNHDKERTASP